MRHVSMCMGRCFEWVSEVERERVRKRERSVHLAGRREKKRREVRRVPKRGEVERVRIRVVGSARVGNGDGEWSRHRCFRHGRSIVQL